MFAPAQHPAPTPVLAAGLLDGPRARWSGARPTAGASPETDLHPRTGNLRGIAVAFFVGTTISGALVTLLGMRFPAIAGSASRDHALLSAFAASLVLAASLVPLARGVSGSAARRFLTLAAFTYVLVAVTTQIDAAVFTDFGGTGAVLLFFLLPCLLAAGTATALIRPASMCPRLTTAFPPPHRSSWWWRAALAWLAYPVVMVAYGIALSPLTRSLIAPEATGVVVPDPAMAALAALARGLLMLAVTLPVLRAWTGSRRLLVLSLGLAYFVLMGLVGLVQATWWAPSVRVTMAALVLAVSVTYAWGLVTLMAPAVRRPGPDAAA